MRRRGTGESLQSTIAYTLAFLAFFVPLSIYISTSQHNAGYWEDYYAKKLALILDRASPGQELYLDVTEATRVAASNGKSPYDIFVFDNVNREVIVSLKQGSATRFSFFSNVTVVDPTVQLISGGVDVNRLHFSIR